MNIKKTVVTCLLAGAWLAPTLAQAGVEDDVYTPGVSAGERSIEFAAGTASKKGMPRTSASSLELSFGVNEWWATGLALKHIRENNEGTRLEAIEWGNKFQLTETGRYPVDVGFILEIERPRDHAEGWEVKWGPLFQTDFDKIQLNLNFLFQRNYRAEVPSQTDFLYQWQTKYRWRESLEFGLQGFGELGKWNDWAPREERTHRVGPAVFGKLGSGHHAIGYNAAWLLGAANGAPDHLLRFNVEYEF